LSELTLLEFGDFDPAPALGCANERGWQWCVVMRA